MKVPESLKSFNEIVTKVVLEKCHGKKNILLPLSGGADSRALLSILLKNHIDFTTLSWQDKLWQSDIRIAKSICKKINREFHVSPDFGYHIHDNDALLFYEHDLVLSGLLMSGLWDQYGRLTSSDKSHGEHVKKMMDWICEFKKTFPMFWVVALDHRIINEVNHVPWMYRMFSYPQRCIIQCNYPGLLRFPFTAYNNREWLARCGYYGFLLVGGMLF